MMAQSVLGPVVETRDGKLRGTVFKGVHVFRGVRYGASTAGANRFIPPLPVPAWAGVREATAWGPSAPQFAVPEHADPFHAWYSAIEPIGEDCLCLNVFTPGLGDTKRPVMVWIHGGGWREFSGTAPGFDGSHLARARDLVVVTINHRLNAFGHLVLDGADERFADSGNAGMLDVVAALRWVADNAAAFGGDPANVTIFGESGGGSKIAAMLSMKTARGLFHKAIIQSSAGGLRVASRNEAAGAAAKLARVLGVAKLDGAALQALPMQTLVAATKAAGGSFRGVADGRVFEDGPFVDRAPAISADVPLLAGCTNTETTYYLRDDPKNFALDLADVRRRIARFLRVDAAAADRVVACYRDAYPDLSASHVMVMITSDFVFKRNTYRMAALQAASARVPVYTYLFERESPVEGGRMRASHTSEVPFVFGTAEAAAAHVGAGPDIAPMTERMMATWTAFARTGDPSNPTVPAWAPYRDEDRRTMVLNMNSRLVVDPGGEARAALEDLPYFGYGHALDAFRRD